MRMTAQIVAVAAMALSCGGSGSSPAGCHANTECADGLVCVLPTGGGGGGGACQAVPLKITMTAPAGGARIGAAGIAVTAHATLGAAGGVAPETLAILVGGDEVGTLAKTGVNGVDVAYEGRYAPAAGASFSGVLFVAARTSAGLVPSDGVAVAVDAKPPALAVLGGGTTCSSGGALVASCPRDGLVDVTVTAQDDNPGVLEVALDLDGFTAAVPFAPAFQGFLATVALAKYPFPAFSRQVQLRVRARDSFGNESTLDLAPLQVTRLRWAYDAGAPVTGAAITAAGEAVVGVSSTTDNLRVVKPDGTEASRTTLAPPGRPLGSFIVSAPSVGATTAWAGSQDGRLYGRPAGGNVFSCPATAPPAGDVFTPAILAGAPEAAYSGGVSAKLFRATPTPECAPAAGISTTDPMDAAPVARAGKVFVVTSRAARSTLRRFSATPAEELAAPTTCGNVPGAPAIGASGELYVGCAGGEVIKADPATLAPTLVATLPDSAQESIVVLPGGDLIVGTNDGKVHRLTPPAGGAGTWTEAWTPPTFTSAVTGTLVAERDASGIVVYAVSATGALDAIADDGAVKWSVPEASSLGAFPLTFPTIAPAPADPNTLPTLYVGSGEGKLYAVVVDKGLDPASPWPKSHHDIRNTGNADAPLP